MTDIFEKKLVPEKSFEVDIHNKIVGKTIEECCEYVMSLKEKFDLDNVVKYEFSKESISYYDDFSLLLTIYRLETDEEYLKRTDRIKFYEARKTQKLKEREEKEYQKYLELKKKFEG